MIDFKSFIKYSLLTTNRYSDNAKSGQCLVEDMIDLAS
jgi:hypothetical protein